MSLEINKNDKSLDASKLPKSSNKLTKKIVGFITVITLFSGSALGTTNINAKESLNTEITIQNDIDSQNTQGLYEYHDESSLNEFVEIPEAYKKEIYTVCGKEENSKITIGDLVNLKDASITLEIYDDSSLKWLNYCSDLANLNLNIYTYDVSSLKDIYKLQNIKRVCICNWNGSTNNVLDIDSENFAFLTRSTGMGKLVLKNALNIEPKLLESIKGFKKLILDHQENYEIDFTKLTFLEELYFIGAPYTVAIDFTLEEYNELVNNGVKVGFGYDLEYLQRPEDLEKYFEINKKLDNIITNLNVNKNSTDQEKLDAILIYVLDNLEYAEQKEGVYFYEGGYLYGTFETNGSICGNFTALTQALAERLELSSYFLFGEDHAWNLINVDGEYYYVDSTWLDGYSNSKEKIISGETNDLNWYMEDPNDYPGYTPETLIRDHHRPLNFPSFIKLDSTEYEENSDIDNSTSVDESIEYLDQNQYEISIKNRKWIVSGGVAVGILAALGGAYVAKKHKNKKTRYSTISSSRRRR